MADDFDLKAAAESLGYQVTSVGEDVVWVRMGPGRQRLVTRDQLLAEGRHMVHRERVYGGECASVHGGRHEFGDGRSKWVTHGKDRGGVPCIQDFASPEGRQHWPKYVTLPDGREGPAPFESAQEQRDYEQLTGQRAVEPDARAETHKRPHLERVLADRPDLKWLLNYTPRPERTVCEGVESGVNDA